MEVAIVTSGYQPVPAAMGGGVEALIDHLIVKNEYYGKMNLTIFSTYHEKSVKMASKIQKTKFIFIKPPAIVRICDRVLYFIAKRILKKKAYLIGISFSGSITLPRSANTCRKTLTIK